MHSRERLLQISHVYHLQSLSRRVTKSDTRQTAEHNPFKTQQGKSNTFIHLQGICCMAAPLHVPWQQGVRCVRFSSALKKDQEYMQSRRAVLVTRSGASGSRGARGYSALELIVVVGISGVVSAIAI